MPQSGVEVVFRAAAKKIEFDIARKLQVFTVRPAEVDAQPRGSCRQVPFAVVAAGLDRLRPEGDIAGVYLSGIV